jgi:hypothetical protein
LSRYCIGEHGAWLEARGVAVVLGEVSAVAPLYAHYVEVQDIGRAIYEVYALLPLV